MSTISRGYGVTICVLVALLAISAAPAPAHAAPTCSVSMESTQTATVFTATWSSNGTSCTWELDGVSQGSIACSGSDNLTLSTGSHVIRLIATGSGTSSCSSSAGAPELVWVHRKYSQGLVDHLPTHDPNEGNGLGYVYQGSVWFYTQPHGGAGNTPAPTDALRRCYNAKQKRHRADTSCGFDVNEGLLGYVLKNPRSGHVPAYQCDGAGSAHFFMSYDSACEGIGVNVGTLGYVIPDPGGVSQANLSTGPSQQCMGRCGMGCNGWMPNELVVGDIYTPQCLAHDQCVLQNGILGCMNGTLAAAAISYYIESEIAMFNSVLDAVKAVIKFF